MGAVFVVLHIRPASIWKRRSRVGRAFRHRLSRRPAALYIYGDGKQVRDVLFVGDLVNAFLRSLERGHEVAGEAFNIGGGPEHTTSVLGGVRIDLGKPDVDVPPVTYRSRRPGDQRIYVSDVRKAQQLLAGHPRQAAEKGVAALLRWLRLSCLLFVLSLG